MGVRNPNREVLKRLDSKTLDARFATEIQQARQQPPLPHEITATSGNYV